MAEVQTASSLAARTKSRVPSWLPVFVAFFGVAVFAFWPSYVAERSQMDARFHLHGVSMFSWCGLLVGQAALARVGRYDIHRLLGRLSPILVIFVVLSAIRLKHWRMQGFEITLSGAYSLASVLFALAAFALFYVLAICYRRDPNTHSRFMLCTLFPLFPPVTDRLIAVRVPEVYSFIYDATGRTGIPFINLAGFLLSDLVLVVLLLQDWRGKGDVRPFAIGISVLLAYEAGILLIYPTSAWIAFSEWFANLPIP